MNPVPFRDPDITQEQIETAFPDVADADGWVRAIKLARADAEVEFRNHEEKGQWGPWTGFNGDDPGDAPWWNAAADYIWKLVSAHVVAAGERGQSPARLESFLNSHIPALCAWVFDQKLAPAHGGMRIHPQKKANFWLVAYRTTLARLQEPLRLAWECYRSNLQPPPKTTTGPNVMRRGRRGPAPKTAHHERVATIVKAATGSDWPNWKKCLANVVAALDEAGEPFPDAWKHRSPKSIDWTSAYAEYEADVIKAISYRLRKANKRAAK